MGGVGTTNGGKTMADNILDVDTAAGPVRVVNVGLPNGRLIQVEVLGDTSVSVVMDDGRCLYSCDEKGREEWPERPEGGD